MSNTPLPTAQDYRRSLTVAEQTFHYYDIAAVGAAQVARLPYSVRVLLECALRNLDNFHVQAADVENIVNWAERCQAPGGVEVPFKPARVLLQDFTGVPAVVDFAAMRDAVARLGGDPERINPRCPVDLVIDHSVQVDAARSPEALTQNQAMEFQRNAERFRFLKWGADAFSNMLIVPPGSGIVHQVNLEHLARVVFQETELYPDSLVGTDSHTTMINGLGVLGWGVGGIEAEACMLGQPIRMLLPQVLGYRLVGALPTLATSTDLVLTIVAHLRRVGVVGKFVEFYGPGLVQLSIADRATIANMCPEYGATCGFFPVDAASLVYLRQTGRDPQHLAVVEAYLRANHMFREDFADASQDPRFTSVLELDLGSVVPSLAGPKRPHDHVPVANMKTDFAACLSNKVGFKGFGLPAERLADAVDVTLKDGSTATLRHGDVMIAAITSCTNTSNPSVMLGAGLLAKKAVEAGLSVAPVVKTSLSPGSGVVTAYLERSGLLPFLQQLGFHVVGYGCMTCIGNSGPLEEAVAAAIDTKDLVVAGVLSGNRNFEGRIHPQTRANYLASPPLVIAYALAGTVAIDFEVEPLGYGHGGAPVFLRDVWPSPQEVAALEAGHVLPQMFREVYSRVAQGTAAWNALEAPTGILYPWEAGSTYIKRPPFFETMERAVPEATGGVVGARALLHLGDSVTTDHISPAGGIARDSAAARFLGQQGVTPRDFNSYGSRRGHDAVMARGTFANIRLVNQLVATAGPRTRHLPSGQELDVFDAAARYEATGTPVLLLAGKEYGSGSSRDWAAKGPWMLGVKAVLAESFERIHRSNLVGMGLIPLQYVAGESAASLGLTGRELFSVELHAGVRPGAKLWVSAAAAPEDDAAVGAEPKRFQVLCRFDTEVELEYYRNGGILHYMIRKMLE